jgi:DNA-binding transcriptional LysR family regulator
MIAAMPWDERTKRRLKLRDLEILMTVVEMGSMGKAASQLKIFQPAVSRAIADLEHALGVTLLERSRQGVEATPYALALTRRGAVVFDELKQGVQDIDFIADPTGGQLRIGTTENMMGGLLPAVIQRISLKYPRISFLVTQGPSAIEQFRELREREADLILGRLPPVTRDDDLNVETLFDDPFLVGASSQNRWTRRRRIELSELMDEPWVLPRPNRLVGGLVADIFRASGLGIPPKHVACSSMQMSNALLATGRYVGIYSGSYLRFSDVRPTIKVLPVVLPIQSGPVGIVTLKRRIESPVVRLFIDYVKKVARPSADSVRTKRH